MLLNKLPVEVLAGDVAQEISIARLQPFSDCVLNFLSELSKNLLNNPLVAEYPDVIGFAYWCRKANLIRLSLQFNSANNRLGRGLALHITPANVPINFAFSLAFGMLSGNANIVRVPSVKHPQTKIICMEIQQLFTLVEHSKVAGMTRLLQYQRDDLVTAAISENSDVRIIWGGDLTVEKIRAMKTSARCVDVCFADRYSLCILDAITLCEAQDKVLEYLIAGFYNDVFLLDQNACSSPHLVLWRGSDEEVLMAKHRFWSGIADYLNTKEKPLAIHELDKYAYFCKTSITLDVSNFIRDKNNLIYRVELELLPKDIENYRCGHGFFFEATDNDFSIFSSIVTGRYQTVTYFGIKPELIINQVIEGGLAGVDRVVPVGKALDIGLIWDGYDIITSLSRIITKE